MNETYEPYSQRDKKDKLNNIETLSHVIRCILGTGLLTLPEAFKYAGLINGSISLIIITVVITHSLHMMFRWRYELCVKHKISNIPYAEAVKAGLLVGPNCLRRFADMAPYIVNGLTIVCQIGTCCIYFVVIALSIKAGLIQNENKFGIELHMIFLLPPLLATTYIKNLKMLVPFSTVGNWLFLATLSIIYYYMIEDSEPIGARNLFANIRTFPLYLGTAMYSFLSVGVIVSIENHIKFPENWCSKFGILNQAMFIVLILNLITGFGGYLKFGNLIKPNIMLNIPTSKPLCSVAEYLLAASLICTYALKCFPVTEILWEQYIIQHMETSQHKCFWEYSLRTIIVLLTYLLSIVTINIALLISLLGSFCLALLGTVFPPLLDICLCWPNEFGKMKWILYKDIGIIFFAFFGIIFGTYTSIYHMIT